MPDEVLFDSVADELLLPSGGLASEGGSPSPRIQVIYNSVLFTNSPSLSRNIGSFVQNTSQTIVITVGNVGEAGSVLSISANGISILSGDGTITVNPSTGHAVNLNRGESTTFTTTLTTSATGAKAIHYKILSNDPTATANSGTPFFFNVNFTITEASVVSPDINLLYGGTIIPDQSTVNLGSFPFDTTNNVNFDIFNYGTPSLIIPDQGIGIPDSGSASLVVNPVNGQAVTLSFGASSQFTIRLDSSTLGTKTLHISIISNDTGTNKNPFNVTITYTIAKAFDLVVKESSEEVSDDETVNLGSFSRRSNILKTISASNRGIFYNIRILGIIPTGDVQLQGIPLLPVVLQPREANVLQFTAKFGSSSLGTRNASINVQWEVAS